MKTLKVLVVIGLVLTACQNSPAELTAMAKVEQAQTQTAVAGLTPTLTLTVTLTPSPAPTSTPTATSTPKATPTQLPEITPPAEGKGNVVGLVLWNNRPVPGAEVRLCEDFAGKCKGANQYKTNTDENGYYVFENVTPGRYLLAIDSFGFSWFLFGVNDGSKWLDVSANETLILDPKNIWKYDLNITYPTDGQAISEPFPTLKWDPYPDAVYYELSLYILTLRSDSGESRVFDGHLIVSGERVDTNEFTLRVALDACEYYWSVAAYNAQGIKIAQTKTQNMKFTVINQPNKCKP